MNHNKSDRKGETSKIWLPYLDGPGSPLDEMMKDHERHIPFMTIKEVCGVLKVSRLTVIRWIRAGRLRATKPRGGRSWRIRPADFDDFVGGKHGRI